MSKIYVTKISLEENCSNSVKKALLKHCMKNIERNIKKNNTNLFVKSRFDMKGEITTEISFRPLK